MAATIREIARKLNISHTTVSRVLSNKKETFIAEETRQRVLTAAKEMGYRPNLAARSLRDSKTNMVGVFGSPRMRLDTGLIPDIIRGIRRVLSDRHFDLFFAFSPEGEEARSALPAWRFDGAVVLQAPTQATIRHLIEFGQPFICINERIAEIPCILCDEEAATRRALDYLWELGHRRIAYANATKWHFDHYSVHERYDTYLAWMQERGADLIEDHTDHQRGMDRTDFVRRTVLEQGATAMLVYDHVVAVDIVSAAQRLGLKIPHDFSLICYNNEFPVERLEPALTVVAPESYEMGRLGAEMLLHRMDAPNEAPPVVTRVSAELILRGSTAAKTT
jgi:LacI family transcriptional regulator